MISFLDENRIGFIEYHMKIIQIMPFFGLGGAETMCENLVYELVKMGHEVIVISLYTKETVITKRFENAGIDLRYLDKKEGLDFSIFKKLREIFKQEKPDVIHTHIYVAKYVFPIAVQLKIRVVHTVHSMATKEVSKYSRILNGIFYRHFDVVPIALSKAIQQTIIDEYNLNQEQVPIIMNGTDLKKCKNKLHYSIDKVCRIIHVGSFLEVKNHIGLIDAFEIFHNKHTNSELHLIGDGNRRKMIEGLVAEKGLSDCVKFYGLQDDVHKYLSKMDIFAFPSLYEGMPMSIVEAMGTGLPIVATCVGGIPDMLDNNSAILVPVKAGDIANAFEKYYLDEALRKKHGQAALQLAGKFSSEAMAEKYVSVYKNWR